MLVSSAILHKGRPYMDGVLPSTIFDLDATIAASTDGASQTWSNLIAAPADGAAQSAYDFYRGADAGVSTDDPAFNGSAGGSAAYWSVDGGDYFNTTLGTNTDFLKKLHKDDVYDWWLAVAFRTPSSFGNTHNGLFGSIGNGSLNGIRLLYLATSDVIRLNRCTTAGTVNTDVVGTGAIATSTDYLLIVSFQKNTLALKAWLNARTASFSGASSALTSPGDCASPHNVMAGGNGGGNAASSGFRCYGISMGAEFLDDARAGLILNHYNARHGRFYA